MANFYSPSEALKNIYSLFVTKLFYPKARLIRRPFYIRGNKKNLIYNSGLTTGYRCRFEMFHNGKISFGQDCKLGDNVHIVSSQNVSFGDECLLASNIFISDTNHGDGTDNPTTAPDKRPLSFASVKIGKCVWIGEGACILQGATIGDGCIIGAHSVVKGVIPPYSIVAGAPARIIKKYNFNTNLWEKV